MDFYTHVYQSKNKMFVRGIKNGKQVKEVYNYNPYLFVNTPNQTKYKSVYGQTVDRIDFDSIWEAKDFLKRYKDVEGMPIYGMTNFMYPFIYDNFHGQINYDPAAVSIVGIDIENAVGDEDIATSIATTPNEITAITISRNGYRAVFGFKDFTPHQDNIKYYRCKDEKHMLMCFLEVWNSIEFSPDVVTGWNIEFYDIPYLVGRITRILGEEYAKKLSPWGMLRPYEVEVKGRTVNSYEIVGVVNLDYLALYRKFIFTPRESYKLDFIAFEELGEQKLDYSEYRNLQDLFERNFQKYVEYNIHDVDLIFKLDDKLKLIELVMAMAYDAKVNYSDTLASVRQWDVIIHNYLMDRCIVVPQQSPSMNNSDLVGGYVKDPQVGMHEWVASLDLDSLYPHLIMHYNIGPETFVERLSSFPSIDQILAGVKIPESEHSIAANGCLYRKDKQGFLAAIMFKMYDDRKVYKNQMIEAKKKVEKIKQELDLRKNPI